MSWETTAFQLKVMQVTCARNRKCSSRKGGFLWESAWSKGQFEHLTRKALLDSILLQIVSRLAFIQLHMNALAARRSPAGAPFMFQTFHHEHIPSLHWAQ
jgi:hypothetical protein